MRIKFTRSKGRLSAQNWSWLVALAGRLHFLAFLGYKTLNRKCFVPDFLRGKQNLRAGDDRCTYNIGAISVVHFLLCCESKREQALMIGS